MAKNVRQEDFCSLSPFFKGERVRVRGGRKLMRVVWPLTPTLSPLREGCQGEREMAP